MAFAVIETGGKQYRVAPGAFVTVEKLETAEGSVVTFDKVLMVSLDKEPVVGAPMIEGATVTATVVSQFKGPKIRVSTYKPKKRQSRTLGHRQLLTQVKIIDILPTKAVKKAVATEK